MKRQSKNPATEQFLKTFGPGVTYRKYGDDDDARLAKRIPEVMREILKKQGWCSYKEQVLWLCDPDDWKPAVRAWFPDAKGAQVFLRTGFGDLCVWDGELFWFVLVHESMAMGTVDDGDWFFSQTITSKGLAPQTYLPERVGAARRVAGSLHWDEMYTYVPALALGGDPSSSRIEKVKAQEALTMLAGLAPIKRRG